MNDAKRKVITMRLNAEGYYHIPTRDWKELLSPSSLLAVQICERALVLQYDSNNSNMTNVLLTNLEDYLSIVPNCISDESPWSIGENGFAQDTLDRLHEIIFKGITLKFIDNAGNVVGEREYSDAPHLV